VELFLPGLGVDWFADEFRPDGWAIDERWGYFLIEAVPVVIFVIVGVIFWLAGSRVRHQKATA